MNRTGRRNDGRFFVIRSKIVWFNNFYFVDLAKLRKMTRRTLQQVLDKLPEKLKAQFEKITGISNVEIFEAFPASYIGTAMTENREWEFRITYGGNIKKGTINEL